MCFVRRSRVRKRRNVSIPSDYDEVVLLACYLLGFFLYLSNIYSCCIMHCTVL
jgi:hypothetical protein